ncbi:nucleolin [Perilla frutescens var. hirtella]|uniref:Nucleolin n=1 Tax=Perilla frutescens var. hirtella TaxID=608512 RepID=A0AAD4P2R6_PERFH|nr:nucleolin [Perilla frutescens var. hirtella]
MADVKAADEGGEFPEKRKLDLPNSVIKALDDERDKDDSKKRQKIEVPAGENGSVSLAAGGNAEKSEEHVNAGADAEEDNDEDDEDEEDYNAEQDEDGDEDANGEAEHVDRKGKGIMVDRKGKGKMIEDSEDDDSDGHVDGDGDSSDDSDSDFSDGLDESDLEDDPLAEVDLDNILPSRTRRSRAQPGLRISKGPDKGNDA